MVEQVIYARDQRYRPEWQYYSMPTSCVGGGKTLQQARASYREALADLLEVRPALLPAITEHMEIPVVDDIWIRTLLTPQRDRDRRHYFDLLKRAVHALDDVSLKELHEVNTVAGVPVMVMALRTDPMSLVLDQISDEDAIWLTLPTGRFGVGWTALYRINADGVQATDGYVSDADDVRKMTVEQFVEEVVVPNTEGFDIEVTESGAVRIPREKTSRQKRLVIA